MAKLLGRFPALLSLYLVASAAAQAVPKFSASVLGGRCSDLVIGDLDGDGLKDLVLVTEFELTIFYQDRQRGFTHEPQQTHHLEHRPCVVWAAKLGRPAASLLVMTSDGVTELWFTNRASPPASAQIISQTTMIPETAEGTNTMSVCLSAETGGAWPLLLVPTKDGLGIWQHQGDWHRVQSIPQAIDARLQPSLANPGYTNSLELDFTLGDLNHDGRDDLIVRRSHAGPTNTYSLYLQQTNGHFDLAMTYADKWERFSWFCWMDLNRDGKADLIKGVWLNEPSFVPGIPSGKVLVSTFIADTHGRIPPEPQQVFRKNDWLPTVPIVDLDGDGFPGLALGYSLMDSREGFRKQLTAGQIDYSLRFFFYRPGAGFPKEADFQRDVVLHLHAFEAVVDLDLPQNFKRFVQLTGDFNGDGKSDLLVRDQGDGMSVYFFVSRQNGFNSEPDLQFVCPEPIEEWEVTDLNHDGISDLIVKLAQDKGFRVFLSQK